MEASPEEIKKVCTYMDRHGCCPAAQPIAQHLSTSRCTDSWHYAMLPQSGLLHRQGVEQVAQGTRVVGNKGQRRA